MSADLTKAAVPQIQWDDEPPAPASEPQVQWDQPGATGSWGGATGAWAQAPPGFEEVTPSQPEGPYDPSVGRRLWDHLVRDGVYNPESGTFIEDPNSGKRALAGLAFGLSGMYGGAKAGGALTAAAGFPQAAPVGMAVGGTVVGTVGVVLGAVSPELAITAMEYTGVLDPGDRPKLPWSAAWYYAENEAMLNWAFGGALTAARTVGRPMVKYFTGANAGTKLADDAAGLGIMLMPIQSGDSTFWRGAASVFGRMPLLATPLRKGAQASEASLAKVTEELPGRFAPLSSWADVSGEVYKDAKNLLTVVDKSFDVRYTDLIQKAKDLGVQYAPANTLKVAEEVLNTVRGTAPKDIAGNPMIGSVANKVEAFIVEKILPMSSTQNGAKFTKLQSLEEMDGLLKLVDQELASLEPAVRDIARAQLGRLRTAMQADITMNGRGAAAVKIGEEMRALDKEFSETTMQLFETTAAKNFAATEKYGLRSGAKFDTNTRTSVDRLAQIVTRLDSPTQIEELGRLVSKETMQRVAANVFDDALTKAKFGGQLDIDVFAKALGIEAGKVTSKKQSIETLLRLSGSPMTMKDLETIVAAGRAIASVEIPAVSAYVARKATLGGGIGAVLNVALPVAGASAIGGSVRSLTGSLMAIVGFRGVSKALADPKTARSFKTVIDAEAKGVFNKVAFAETLHNAIVAVSADDTGIGVGGKMQQIDPSIQHLLGAVDPLTKYLADQYEGKKQ